MIDDSPGPIVPLRTSARIKEKHRKSLPARTTTTTVEKRSFNSINVQPASTEVISSIIDTLSAISSPAEQHFDRLAIIAASQSTPSSLSPWREEFNSSSNPNDNCVYKRDPPFSARAGFGMERKVPKKVFQEGSALRSDNDESILDARATATKRSSNDLLRQSFIASSATRRKEGQGEDNNGLLSVEPGKMHSSVATESTTSRGRRSYNDLRLKMSKDRMMEHQSRLYIDEDGQRSYLNDQLTQPLLQLSDSWLDSETAPRLSAQPSPLRIPKRMSSARHSAASQDLSNKAIVSSASLSSFDSPRRVPNRDSSLRHSFSVSPSQSKRTSHRSSTRESRHTRRSSIESEAGLPEYELAKVLDDLAEDNVSRRIKELKNQKRIRELDLTITTLNLPPKNIAKFDSVVSRPQFNTDRIEADEPGDMRLTPLSPDGKNANVVADASAPPPAIAQRIERNTSMRVSSLWSNTSASPSPSTVKRDIELPRTHSGPPQRSSSKLFRRLSRSTSPTTAAKHRRTFSGPITSSQVCAEERPASVDPIVGAVYDYLSSPRLSQKVIDPQTGRVISFSEIGDPVGSVVFCCVGMGLTRYITAFYDELAVTLKLRLITPDRPGVGASDAHTDGSDTPLGWPEDVRAICAHLKINKFSLLAHSAGAIYALATALRMPQHIRGRIHLLAPWIPPSQMSVVGTQQEPMPAKALPYSQRFLKSLPTTFLKAANSSFLNATSASITTSLPKSPWRSKPRDWGSEPANSGVDSQNELPSSQLPRIDSEPLKATASDNEDLPPEAAASRPSLPNRRPSRLTQKERQQNYDARLSEAIWEYATTDANPAVDLLVCLERRQPIGFRYVDITKAIVIHHGSKDTRVPVENVKWLGKTMRKCEVRVLEGEGHGLMASAAVMGNVLMEMAQEWEDWNRVTQGRGAIERRVTSGI